jgi:hypothetical protein
MTRETWDYVNWLTHAKNAGNYDAEIGTAAVSHVEVFDDDARLLGNLERDRCTSPASTRSFELRGVVEALP